MKIFSVITLLFTVCGHFPMANGGAYLIHAACEGSGSATQDFSAKRF